MTAVDDGRVEDGEVTECDVCGVTMHMYDTDKGICPGCAHEGWEWKAAMYIRRGDVICVNTEQIEIEAEEDFGKRIAIYAADERMWMKPKIEPVLRRKHW